MQRCFFPLISNLLIFSIALFFSACWMSATVTPSQEPDPGSERCNSLTGESIIFWIDDSDGEPHTEAHIQIQYEGDPEKFAWVIP